MGSIGAIARLYASNGRWAEAIFVNRLPASTLTIWRIMRALAERQASRKLLQDMTDDQLRDIGLSHMQASAEARRQLFEGQSCMEIVRRTL